MTNQKVCYVSEGDNVSHNEYCPDCKLRLLAHLEGVPNGFQNIYPAPTIYATGNLQAWRFGDGEWHAWTDPFPVSRMLPIPLPPLEVFEHLCIKYNLEGAPLINIVAVAFEKGAVTKIRPRVQVGTKGDDPACPVESATIQEAGSVAALPFPPSSLVWNPRQPTVFDEADQDLGAWTCEPDATPGVMTLVAKPQLKVDVAAEGEPPVEIVYLFDSWLMNSLSNWHEDEEHQWEFGHKQTKAEFDKNDQLGLIAYYRPLQLADGEGVVDDETKPGDYERGYPAPFIARLAALVFGLPLRLLRWVGDRLSGSTRN